MVCCLEALVLLEVFQLACRRGQDARLPSYATRTPFLSTLTPPGFNFAQVIVCIVNTFA